MFLPSVTAEFPTTYWECHTIWLSKRGRFTMNSSAQQLSTCHKPTLSHAMQTVIHCSGTSYVTRSSCPIKGQDRPLGVQDVEGPRISRKSAYESGKIANPKHRLPLPPQEISLVHISVRDSVKTKTIVRPERLNQWKLPLTLSGIEPVTYHLVTQSINWLHHHITPSQTTGHLITVIQFTFTPHCIQINSFNFRK